VVQLPPRIVYEQPVVTIVKKQTFEVEAIPPARGSTKAPLPRLKPAAAQGGKGASEVTRLDLRKYDDLFGRVERMEATFASVKNAIDTLNKSTRHLQEVKADKDALQGLFDQFRLAMGELNNRIGSLRKGVVQKADVSELLQLRQAMQKDMQIMGETAAGTETVKCLLCGNPRHNVVGAIPLEEAMARNTGPGTSSRVQGLNGDGSACFVYGEGGRMYHGRSTGGRSIVMKHLLPPSNVMPLESEDPETTQPEHE